LKKKRKVTIARIVQRTTAHNNAFLLLKTAARSYVFIQVATPRS